MFRHSVPGMQGIRGLVRSAEASDRPIELSRDLGRMLLDIRYDPDGSGRGTPVFFEARLERGIMRVPHIHEVLGD